MIGRPFETTDTREAPHARHDQVVARERGSSYRLPPHLYTADGETRRVGVELEFAGISAARTSALLVARLGGRVTARSPIERRIQDSALGTIRIEYDFHLLKRERYLPWLERVGVDPDGDWLHAAEQLAGRLAGLLVPVEITTAPLPMHRLSALDAITTTLHEAGARGTGDRLRNAFALHLNPTVPDLSAPCLLRYLRAFVLLEPWIRRLAGIDTTRKLARYATPHPREFCDRVLDRRYKPELPALIRDYLNANPTRNRSLDLLPALAMIDESTVRDRMEEPELLKPRPTFHYRLPDCRVDDKTWSVALPWNQWIEVERVASNPIMLDRLCREWRHNRDEERWPERVEFALSTEATAAA